MTAYLIAVLTIAAIYSLLTLGLNLQYGMTGIINFGHVGFFCVGAYASALLTVKGWPPVAGFALAAVLAGACAWPLGLVSLRLRDDYFAIVSLGFSEIVRLVVTSEGWLTGGVQGVAGVPKLFAGLGPSAGVALLAALVVVNLLAALALLRIARSPFGRVIEAIRDNEDAVKALGKDPARFKMQSLALGAALAGVSGAFYAHYIGYISPDQFTPLVTFQIWMALVMGGVGRVWGAVLGAGLLMALLEGSRFLRDVAPFISEVSMASVRLGAVGLLLILFTLYRPQGLVGDEARK